MYSIILKSQTILYTHIQRRLKQLMSLFNAQQSTKQSVHSSRFTTLTWYFQQNIDNSQWDTTSELSLHEVVSTFNEKMCDSQHSEQLHIIFLEECLLSYENQLGIIQQIISSGDLRSKIKFTAQKQAILAKVANVLKQIAGRSDNSEAYLNKCQEIYKTTLGTMSEEYIVTACQLSRLTGHLRDLDEIYNRLVQFKDSKLLMLVGIHHYLISQDELVYERITKIQSEYDIDDQQLKFEFHIAAMRQALQEGYQVSLEVHVEKCLNLKLTQMQFDQVAEFAFKINQRSQIKATLLYKMLWHHVSFNH